jgi:hypothetical protein
VRLFVKKGACSASTPQTSTGNPGGAAQGSAVRPGSRTKVSVPLLLPQNRHPERSASQIDRVTRRLWRGVEGPRRCLIYPCCSELFHHRRTPTGSAATRTLYLRVHLFIHCLVLGPQGKTVAGPAGAGSVVEKRRAAWANQAPPRSFDSAPQALCHTINL